MRDAFTLADRAAQARTTRSNDRTRSRKLALASLLQTEFGRVFLWDELEAANVFGLTYTPGSFDMSAFKEGQRDAGNRLLMELITHFPNEYILMTRENAPKGDSLTPSQENLDE